MPFDSTEKKIKEIHRLLSSGKMDHGKALSRLESLESLGPVWVARWELPSGKTRTRACGSFKEAQEREILERAKMKIGEGVDLLPLKASIADVLDFYLEKQMKGKVSYKNARAHADHCKALIGRVRLNVLDRNPEAILDQYFEDLPDKFPASFRTDKSVWNNKTILKAALTFYIRKKRLRILNPVDVMDMPMPKNPRQLFPTLAEHEARIIEAGKSIYPRWVQALLIAGWEHGLRMGEYLSWTWEGATLDAVGEDLPWMRTIIQKQRKTKSPEEVWREIPLSAATVAALMAIPAGNRERGKIWTVSRATVDLWVRRVLDACGQNHLQFHDNRRAWKLRHLHTPQALRMKAQGHKTEAMDAWYLVMGRKELEPLVRGSYEDLEP